MAYTKIHAITATVGKAVDYICNPAKTDEGILISSYGCSPKTAAYDFKFALSKTSQSNPNKAYHLIQSFFPGEVAYKEAHQIGIELADKLLESKYSYVVTTHIDKGHIHNHIIFCAADNVNHEKYHDCKKTYYNIRNLSDNLCKEHGLSVITPGEKTLSAKRAIKGKTYKEWQASKNNSSWKETLKSNIDEAIKTVATYEDFIALIKAKGYEIKGEAIGNTSSFKGEKIHKFISFRPLDREHFVRGSAKSLGTEYTKERIKERIEEKALVKEKKRVPFPTRKKLVVKDYSKKDLIDITGDKFAESPGLKHWADIQNLKIAAASYSQAGSITEIERQIASKSTLAKTARQSLVETEHKLKDLGQILKYAEQYKANHIYHVRYLKSKDKDAYFRRHESDLILHDGAENMLKRFGINLQTVNVEKLRSDYNALYSQKQELQKTYKSAEKEIVDLNHKLDNLNQYLNRSAKQKTTDQKIEKPSNSL